MILIWPWPSNLVSRRWHMWSLMALLQRCKNEMLCSIKFGYFCRFRILGLKLLPIRWTLMALYCYNLTNLPFQVSFRLPENENLCGICYDRRKDCVLFPCGHPFCTVCGTHFVENNQPCPLCRKTVLKACSVNA